MYRSSRIGTHILMTHSISVLCHMHESITNRLSSNLEGASCFSASAEKHLTEISPCTIGNSTTSTNCTSEIAQNRLTRVQTPLPKKTMSPFCTIPHSSTAVFESSTALFQASFSWLDEEFFFKQIMASEHLLAMLVHDICYDDVLHVSTKT